MRAVIVATLLLAAFLGAPLVGQQPTEKDKRIKEIAAEIATLEKRLADLKRELAKLQGQPSPTDGGLPGQTSSGKNTALRSFEAIDKHALNAPQEAEKSLDSLAKYLAEPCKTDKEKVRAVFRWVTDRIMYDFDGVRAGKLPSTSAEAVLKSRKAVCQGYTKLFAELCNRLGVKAVIVSGKVRSTSTAVGFPDNHAWNAAYFDNKWWLIEPTMGAGAFDGKKFVKRFKDVRFMTPPETSILTHFPTDRKWQLLDKPLTATEFEKQPKVSSFLLDLGVTRSAIYDQLKDKPFKDFVQIYYPPSSFRIIDIPFRKHLQAGKKYEFHLESDDFDGMVMMAASDGSPLWFTKDKNQFKITLTPKAGILRVFGKMPGEQQIHGVLEYLVEDGNK